MAQVEDTWHASVLTIYPDMFPGPLSTSLLGTALENDIWSLQTIDIRDFANGKHRSVDDTPYGGGPGMVMRPDIIDKAITHVKLDTVKGTPFVYVTPRGAPLSQSRVREMSLSPGVVILCGRFEGVDERVLEEHGIEEVCLGDYVLSGGEIAAMAMLEACVRLLPCVLGSSQSIKDESFECGLLEHPHYTRPKNWNGRKVPEVLLSGHHANIEAWRLSKSEEITRERRPDLWQLFTSKLGE